eukprot:3797894-Pyramimonas_sp.AAC.1
MRCRLDGGSYVVQNCVVGRTTAVKAMRRQLCRVMHVVCAGGEVHMVHIMRCNRWRVSHMMGGMEMNI